MSISEIDQKLSAVGDVWRNSYPAQRGDIYGDYARMYATQMLPSLLSMNTDSWKKRLLVSLGLSTVNGVGIAHGLKHAGDPISKTPTLLSGLPGFAQDRFYRRMYQATRPYGTKRRSLFSEVQSSTLANELTGIAMTHLWSKKWGKNALGNASAKWRNFQIFNALPQVAGGLAAAIMPTRTREQQRVHDSKWVNDVLNWVVPGMADYNLFKRMGRISADEREHFANETIKRVRNAIDKFRGYTRS